MEFIGEWTYGKVYSISARLLMSNIYEALGKNDTFIIIKSPDYRIKVKNILYYKIKYKY